MNPEFPITLLLEDRPKQQMIYQLNLSIYIGASVKLVKTLAECLDEIEKQTQLHLIVLRQSLSGSDVVAQIKEKLKKKGQSPLLISLGRTDAPDPDIVYLDDSSPVKLILQAAAKPLGITAQQMASKDVGEYYPIPPSFLSLLFSFPCDIFRPNRQTKELLFKRDQPANRAQLRSIMKAADTLFIPAKARLKFANSFTEQCGRVTEELASHATTGEKKMKLLDASVDILATQLQKSGMDEEVVQLAKASIDAIGKVAKATSGTAKEMLEKLRENQVGYQYLHIQLLTFVGYHAMKLMGWWGENNRDIFAQAAFYHDVFINVEDDGKVRTTEEALLISDAARRAEVLAHPKKAAVMLRKSPEIRPEVIDIVLRHHGSKTGSEFSRKIADFDLPAKLFILAEEWVDFLIQASGKNQNNEARLEELKTLYPDETSLQIIETLRYLDPIEFSKDFSVDTEMEQILGGGSGAEEAQKVPGGADALEESLTHVKGMIEEANLEQIVAGITDSIVVPIQSVKGILEKSKDPKQQIKDLTDHFKTERIKVKEKLKKQEEENFNVLSSIEALVEDAQIKIEEAAKDPDPKTAIGKMQELMDSTRVKVMGSLEKVTDKTLVKGFKEKFDEEMIKIKGKLETEPDPKKMIEGVTVHLKELTSIVRGKVKEKDETLARLGGKVDHIFDQTLVRIGSSLQGKKSASTIVQENIQKNRGDLRSQGGQGNQSKVGANPLQLKGLAGVTDLMVACLAGDLGKVQALSADAKMLRKTDSEGRNCFHYAAMGGFVPVLQFLSGLNMNKNATDSKRRTPIFLAVAYKKEAAFDFLLAQGARINQQTLGGVNLAMMAAQVGNLKILEIALKSGIRKDANDHAGKTVVDYAKVGKSPEVLQFLKV